MESKQGFTVVEVLVAIAILSFFMAVFLSGVVGNMKLNNNVQSRNEAARLAEQFMENYRQKGNYGTMRGTTQVSQAYNGNGKSYTVKTIFCPNDTPVNMPCDSQSVYIRLQIIDGTKTLQNLEAYFTKM